jgi:hypothetical protein
MSCLSEKSKKFRIMIVVFSKGADNMSIVRPTSLGLSNVEDGR